MNMENQKPAQSGKYEINSLIEMNDSYNNKHKVSQSDVDMANMYVELIESSRSEVAPQAGDMLRYTDKHGSYYAHAHIEENSDGICNICENPYDPFIWSYGTGIKCSTSGGAWTGLPSGELKYVGKQEKTFRDWGHCGACANGAIRFKAEVSVWEYVHPAPLYGEFTTEKWRKIYVTRIDETNQKNNGGYLYTGDNVSFRTEEEFRKFIETYKGTVFSGFWQNQYIIWCYKEEQKQVSQKEYYNLDLPLITIYCNGQRSAKVKYDDDSKTAIVYFVMQSYTPDN
ncbi:DUF4121 family protein [Bacteroides cellulosilyticus]|uniref:DUF4121 family protein n=1 Tax=Bacteroides cellulosilyticus TaxID=246787 RepID=UPI0022E1FC27|nr:DUF4121 family protein [Bacteroides cellulosilyticus]